MVGWGECREHSERKIGHWKGQRRGSVDNQESWWSWCRDTLCRTWTGNAFEVSRNSTLLLSCFRMPLSESPLTYRTYFLINYFIPICLCYREYKLLTISFLLSNKFFISLSLSRTLHTACTLAYIAIPRSSTPAGAGWGLPPPCGRNQRSWRGGQCFAWQGWLQCLSLVLSSWERSFGRRWTKVLCHGKYTQVPKESFFSV